MLADLYYARYHLYHQQDRRGFTDVLKRILGRSDEKEDFRLFNKIAKDRARLYLDATDSLFID